MSDVTVRIEETAQRNVLAAMRRRLLTSGVLKKHVVSIGIHEDEGAWPKLDYDYLDSDRNVVSVMTDHEFGNGVPERSFLREYFDTHKPALAQGMHLAMRESFMGAGPIAIEEWAADAHADWVHWIEYAQAFMPLSPVTIERRDRAGIGGGDEPLVATRQFLESFLAYMDGEVIT